MLGTVDHIDYDGNRVLRVVLRFPASRADGADEQVKEVTTCERVGQGSFGTVYRALCDGYSNLALKISTGKSTRLKQELDVLSKTCTKGRLLLPRFEFGALNKTGDLIVIGMELCVPRTLHDFLIGEKLYNESDKLFIAYQAALAISYVHGEGCIHRDVKLQNFVFDLYGNLKLIDFGLACNSLKPPAGDVVAGTVSFMAPEMAHNALHKERRVSVGAAGDVWSLGIVIFSIFTQRNPYPSDNAAPRESREEEKQRGKSVPAREGTDPEPPAAARDAAASLGSAPTGQRIANERLLQRVAAGQWRWPAVCPVSAELRRLVDSILMKDPSKRPTIAEVLGDKIWNLRRRAPPEALERFLGVQDDLLLSHDEAHLLRAVEQRSAGVAASLLTTRAPSTDRKTAGGDGALDADHDNAGTSLSTVDPNRLTPVRANGSLKVVTRADAEVGGVPAVQIYDVRASTKKHSKPIRDISQAIADETAKSSRPKAGGSASRSRSRQLSKHGSLSSSLQTSRASSVTSSGAQVHTRKGTSRGARGGRAGDEDSSLATAGDNMFDADGVEQDGGMTAPVGDTSSSAAGRDASEVPHSGAATRQRQAEPSNSGATASTPPCAAAAPLPDSERPLFSSNDSPILGEDEENARGAARERTHRAVRAGSLSLVSTDGKEDVAGQAASADDAPRTSRPRESKKRQRDQSLRHTSSSVLGGLISDNGFLSSTSRPGSSSRGAPPVLTSARDSRPRPTARSTTPQNQIIQRRPAVRRPLASPTDEVAETFSEASVAAGEATHAAARPLVKNDRPTAQPLAAELEALMRTEKAAREVLRATLLVEHGWLLASFRLTIEEDQERYNITWLGAEQAKSAAHAHKFKEMHQVPSKKYQYGFVCDFCDYEFLPTGRTKTLHFFHCTCGRDLCPECYEEYMRKCTCACCDITHPNSCALRDHLAKHTAHAISRAGGVPATRVGTSGIRASTLTAKRGRKQVRATATTRATAPSPEKPMHMSIAAMEQREIEEEDTVDDLVPLARAAKRRKASAGRVEQSISSVAEGPWRPFAKMKRELAVVPTQLPTPEEREVMLNGEWVRYFYLYPNADSLPVQLGQEESPFAFVYHIQQGRTGAVFLSSEFAMHSAVLSMLECQLFIVDQVNTLADDDSTRVTTLAKAKSHPSLHVAFNALQEIVSYDTNMLKQGRTPGTVSVNQAPRNARTGRGDPYVFVRWFRFNEDRSLSAFLLSNGAVQVFVNNEFELRWFDEAHKFLVRANGVCEVIGDSTFALAPAINQLLYGTFDV